MATWSWRALYGAGANPIVYVSPQQRGSETFETFETFETLETFDTSVADVPANKHRAAHEAASDGLIYLEDGWPGSGPLAAILTALRFAQRDGALTALSIACDVPSISSVHVRSVHERVVHTENLYAVGSDGSRDHWSVVAMNVPACIRIIEGQFASGERSMHRAFAHMTGARVVLPADSLRNVNEAAMLESWSVDG